MDDYRLQSGTQTASVPTGKIGGAGDRDSTKTQYTIGEVAKEFGFTLRALRFYEEKGLISPRRIGNRRLYTHRDHQRLEIISQGKRIGLPLDDIRAVLRAGDSSGDDDRMMKVALDKALERVESIKTEREQLHESLQEALLMIADLKRRLGKAA